MASTLKKGPLQVSIIETYTLNGREHSVKNDVVYNDIRETSSRIVAITDSTTLVAGVPVFTTHATQPGLGQYVLNDKL